jgi:hypothetical protein
VLDDPRHGSAPAPRPSAYPQANRTDHPDSVSRAHRSRGRRPGPPPARPARKAGAPEGWAVKATPPPRSRTNPGHGVARVLWLWRVQPGGRRLAAAHRLGGAPARRGGLRLRHLPVVRRERRRRGANGARPLCGGAGPAPRGGGSGHAGRRRRGRAGGGERDAAGRRAYLRLAEVRGDPPPRVVPHVAPSVRLRPPAVGRIPDPPGTEMP